MAIDFAKARDIFTVAVEKPDLSEQGSYLDEACGTDAELRQHVVRLLGAHEQSASFLDQGAVATPAIEFRSSEAPGTIIGPYKLLEQIGEGGFGVVFLAEQATPIRRRVALKIVKPGMDTRQVLARFEAERQALALMDHPGIAKVFDAGVTEQGRSYFVMELVQGVPINEYCDECNLPTRERLSLFIAVCQAVQHAHQKGIIHRDLKPTNVLIALQDGRPVPKIIDFGIAKAIEQRLTDHTLTTGFAQMIGTPMYMSPEQAELSPLGVDTRTDIYSLGVLLYELLSGTTPFDKDRLQAAGYDELRRIIREEEPPRPSSRLTTLAAGEATTIAAHRRSDPRHLHQQVRGDLDWIVMKCLEKDRNRRYDSAGSLARDVERYLHDEPVQACPPSSAYWFRKLVRRHQAKLAVSSVIFVTLLFGLGLATWQYIRATTENARAQAVSNLLQAILAPSDPEQTKGSRGNLRELSDEFSAALGDQVADYHVQLAEILTNQSRIPRGPEDARQLSIAAASRIEEAHRHVRRAIDAYDRMAIDSAHDFDRRAESTSGFIQVLKVCLATPGFAGEVDELNGRLTTELPNLLTAFPDSNHCQLQTAYRYVNWAYALGRYPDYRSVQEHAFRKEIEILEKLSLSNPKQSSIWLFLADAYDHLGSHYWESARPQEAEAAFLRAKEIYDQHPAEITAETQSQPYGIGCHYGRLAYFLAHAHREDEAAECVRKAVDVAKRIADPVQSITVLWGMTPLQLRMGDHGGYRETCQALLDVPIEEADDFTKVRQIFAWVLGPNAMDDLSLPIKRAEELAAHNSLGLRDLILLDLGAALYRNRQYERAADELEASIAAYPGDPEPGYDSIGLQRLFLAMAKWQLGHHEEARQLLAKTLPIVDNDLQSTSLGWNQRVALEVLRREAEALIKPEDSVEVAENETRKLDP